MLNHLVSLVCFVHFFNFIICNLFNCDLSNSHIEGNYFRQNSQHTDSHLGKWGSTCEHHTWE